VVGGILASERHDPGGEVSDLLGQSSDPDWVSGTRQAPPLNADFRTTERNR